MLPTLDENAKNYTAPAPFIIDYLQDSLNNWTKSNKQLQDKQFDTTI